MALLERRSTILIALLLALSLGSAACSDDASSGDGNGEFKTGQQGKVSATPNPVTFETVALGEETSVSVMITNTGEATLKVSKIDLHEKARDGGFDDVQEFIKEGDGWDVSGLEIEPGKFHTIQVRYKPENQTLDEGSILIESNDPENSRYIIPVSTQGLAPKIFSPATVSFPRVSPPSEAPEEGEPAWRGGWKVTQVQNTGEAPLSISDIKVQGGDDSRFDFSIPQRTDDEIADGTPSDPENDIDAGWPDPLEPGERFDLRVWFAPDDTNPEEDTLVFSSNDPSSPEYSVNLVGNSGSPCIEVSPADGVDFALGSIGNVSQKTVTITNCSPSSELKLSEIVMTDDGGGVYAIKDGSLPSGLPEEDFVLEGGARANFVVTFSPTQEETYDGMLKIKSNDTSQPVVNVPITGRGTNNACPTAVASATIQGVSSSRPGTMIQAQPLANIDFDGSGSSDPDGTIERYEWTVLSAPAASTERVLPAGSATPSMFMDINGEYKVELKVYDDQNTVSCGEPAIVTIVVNSDQDIHIQLTWSGGANVGQQDVDLHYLHPSGAGWGFNSRGWDCYYNNMTPVWGSGAYGSPTLDIDDLSGPGPENISHSDLENLTYKVGVHYFNDYGNGAAFATIEIRKHGVVIFAAQDKQLSHKQFWQVALLNGRSLSVSPVDQVTAGFPN